MTTIEGNYKPGAGGGPRIRVSPAAQTLLEQYDWPGDVRELETMIRRAAAFASEDASVDEVVLGPEHFPQIAEAVARRARGIANEAGQRASMEPLAPEESGPGSPAAEFTSPGAADASAIRAPNGVEPSQAIAGRDGGTCVGADWLRLADVEQNHIRRTLERTGFDETAAATLLGIDQKLLIRKIREYGLQIARQPRFR